MFVSATKSKPLTSEKMKTAADAVIAEIRRRVNANKNWAGVVTCHRFDLVATTLVLVTVGDLGKQRWPDAKQLQAVKDDLLDAVQKDLDIYCTDGIVMPPVLTITGKRKVVKTGRYQALDIILGDASLNIRASFGDCQAMNDLLHSALADRRPVSWIIRSQDGKFTVRGKA